MRKDEARRSALLTQLEEVGNPAIGHSGDEVMTGLYDRIPEPRRIDYDRMSSEYPKVKGLLTRAEKSGDPTKVLVAVERFITLSDEVGAMPDDWHRWRNALEDAWRELRRDEDLFELSVGLPGGFVDRFQCAAERLA